MLAIAARTAKDAACAKAVANRHAPIALRIWRTKRQHTPPSPAKQSQRRRADEN
tara:strand:- start:3626 stop:3787 length:162 start_codon:yes stop_codon:yes gene_type:complete